MPATPPTYLEVEHSTVYRYARPVEFSPHRVLFRPRAAHDLRVLSSSLVVSPASKQYWIHDVFSNSVTMVEPLLPADELRFTARFCIEHHGVNNLELPMSPEAKLYPFAYNQDDYLDLANYLPLQYPEDAAPVSDWVRQFLPVRGQTHTRDILANINQAIRDDFSYAPRDIVGTQRPAATLASRTGTCRDFALLMMEAVRGLGLAARFVSGYLYDPAMDANSNNNLNNNMHNAPLLGAGATHAWLHVYLPGAGWVPYDPTNTLCGGTDLIRVAYTRTPEQASPVSGGWVGAAGDFLGMEVNVQVRRINTPPPAVASGDEFEP